MGFPARLRRLRAIMREHGWDAFVVSNPTDIAYLSGFHGESSVAVVGGRSVTVVSDRRFEEELDALRRTVRSVMRSGAVEPRVAGVLEDLGARAVAVQSEHMSVASRIALEEHVPSDRFRDTEGVLASMRAVKDASEVAAIRRAIRVQERAMEALLEDLTPGMRESEIAARLEQEMKSRGASGPAFATIAAADANGSKPHAIPGGARAKRGGTLLMDWGARVDGYVGDLTRVFAFGAFPREVEEIYAVCLEAQLSAIDAVRAGVEAREVDRAARSVIEDAGYGERFSHALGHGIGLDVHERPRVGREVSRALESGMVITIEPGIYVPGVGGVRLEDDILVTDRGAEVLSGLPKDLGWATR